MNLKKHGRLIKKGSQQQAKHTQTNESIEEAQRHFFRSKRFQGLQACIARDGFVLTDRNWNCNVPSK